MLSIFDLFKLYQNFQRNPIVEVDWVSMQRMHSIQICKVCSFQISIDISSYYMILCLCCYLWIDLLKQFVYLYLLTDLLTILLFLLLILCFYRLATALDLTRVVPVSLIILVFFHGWKILKSIEIEWKVCMKWVKKGSLHLKMKIK